MSCQWYGTLEGMIIITSDTDYTRELDQRRSTTGYVFTIAEYIISQKVELQNIIALSMTEAEYMTAIETLKEAL